MSYADLLSKSSDVDYAYAYGRVSGMAGKLISRQELENLSSAVSVDEIVASLETTPYGIDISGVVWSPKRVFEIERALYENYAGTYDEILSLIPENDAREVDALLRGVYNHRNLKLILRAIRAGADASEVKKELNAHARKDYEQLLSAATEKEFLRLLDEPYKSKLSASGVLDKDDLDANVVESLMDVALVESWFETLGKKELLDYAGVVADTTNLLTIVRCTQSDVNAADYIAGDGKQFSHGKLLELSSLSVEALVEKIKNTPYAKPFTEGVKALHESGSLSLLEKNLDDYVVEYVNTLALEKPLSVYSVLAFLGKKITEVFNLRKIIILKSHQIPSEKIKSTLSFT